MPAKSEWHSIPFQEAIDFLRGKTSITKVAWSLLDRKARLRAFTVARISSVDVIKSVLKSLQSAVESGKSLQEFKREQLATLKSEWRGSVVAPGKRVELIYRTNVQTAYAIGRWSQQSQPDSLQSRPFGMFSAIMDRRTSATCRALSGKIISLNDPFWRRHYPPLHFQCRSTVIALSPEQATARGGPVEPPRVKVDPGFGNIAADWEPPKNRETL